MMSPQTLDPNDLQDLESFLSKFDTFLFDCDGVLWINDSLIPNVNDALDLLRSRGKQLAFCTNNATQSRVMYKQKFHKMGLQVSDDEIFTSAQTTAHYLQAMLLPTLPKDKQGIYLIGQKGMEDEMKAEGLKWEGGTDPRDDVLMPYQDFSSIHPEPSIGVVCVAFDMHINYKKLCRAYSILANSNAWEEHDGQHGAKLVLTNDDPQVPLNNGCVVPGEGALASTLRHARKDLESNTIVVGKPNKLFFDAMHSKMKFDKTRALMIGDRMETDILFGKAGGVSTLWVLSGAGKLEDLRDYRTDDHPDYIASSFGIFSALQKGGQALSKTEYYL